MKRSNKLKNSFVIYNISSQGRLKENIFKEGECEEDVNYTTPSTMSLPIKKVGDVSVEREPGNKEYKKRKHKQKEELDNNNKPGKNISYAKDLALPRKKPRKEEVMDEAKYKPGMLSDILQKKKYGSLILPWETSFGNEKSSCGSNSQINETEQKKKIKLNPLFDMTKRNEESNLSKSSRPTIYTVFVGNLPHDVTVYQVKKIFKKFGNTVKKIKIRSQERKHFVSGRSNFGDNEQCRYATVKLSSPDSYEAALNMNGKLCNGHHLRITASKSGTGSDPEKSVFVGNLTTGLSDDDLWKTFESCGEIDSVRVIRDILNKKGNFGYVNFKSADAVAEALKLDGISVLNRNIRVSQIKKNIGSLSNSIIVKRKKKKRMRPQPMSFNYVDGSENSADTEEKIRKSQKNKIARDVKYYSEPDVSSKIKKKKKKGNAVSGDEGINTL